MSALKSEDKVFFAKVIGGIGVAGGILGGLVSGFGLLSVAGYGLLTAAGAGAGGYAGGKLSAKLGNDGGDSSFGGIFNTAASAILGTAIGAGAGFFVANAALPDANTAEATTSQIAPVEQSAQATDSDLYAYNAKNNVLTLKA